MAWPIEAPTVVSKPRWHHGTQRKPPDHPTLLCVDPSGHIPKRNRRVRRPRKFAICDLVSAQCDARRRRVLRLREISVSQQTHANSTRFRTFEGTLPTATLSSSEHCTCVRFHSGSYSPRRARHTVGLATAVQTRSKQGAWLIRFSPSMAFTRSDECRRHGLTKFGLGA